MTDAKTAEANRVAKHREMALSILRMNRPGAVLKQVEVAALLVLDTKTIANYANDGKLPYIRTPGGRRLFPADAVRALFVWEEADYQKKADVQEEADQS